VASGQEQAQRVARFRSVLVSRYDDAAWRSRAACSDVEPDLFFPVGLTGPAIEQTVVAKAVCYACPVRMACLKFAVATNQEFGIWGGLDEEERRVLRRKWRAGGNPFDDLAGAQSQPAAS